MRSDQELQKELITILRAAESKARQKIRCGFLSLTPEEYDREMQRVKREFPQPKKRGMLDPGPK